MSNLKALLKIEFILFRRNWSSFILGTGLPVMIFLLMATVIPPSYPPEIKPNIIAVLLISMTIYSSISFAIYTFPVLFVEDRHTNWVKFVERAPIKNGQYYFVKFIRIMLYFVVSIIIIFLVGKFVEDVNFTVLQWIILAIIITFGSICMMSIGFIISLATSTEKVSVVSNIIYIFLSILGGLWWPLDNFPEVVQNIGKIMPTYHINHLAQQYIFKDSFESKSFFILIAYAVVLVTITLIAKRKIK